MAMNLYSIESKESDSSFLCYGDESCPEYRGTGIQRYPGRSIV